MPLNIGKPEKKDNKQILLDLIEKQYGLSNAVVMEKALKTQDKQIEQAMMEGGATADQIGQTKGVDVSLLDKLMQGKPAPERVAPAQPQPQPQQQQGNGVMSTALPALGKLLMAMGEGWQGQPYGSTALRQSETQLNLAKAQQAPAENEYLELRKQREERLQKQYELTKTREFGGRISLEEIDNNEQGIDFNSLIEGYGLTPKTNPGTGEKFYDIPSDIERREITKRGTISTKEMEYLDNYMNLIDGTDETIKSLQDLGVVSISDIGTIKTEMVENPNFGPVSMPARFDLLAQYKKDPKYKIIKDKLDRLFQVYYRKPVTGQQAGAKELELLRRAFASFTQRPQILVGDLQEISNEANRAVDNRLNSMKNVGRDISKFEEQITAKRNKSLTYKTQQQGIQEQGTQQQTGWSPDKAKRLEELRKKKAAGTLGR